MTTLSSRLKLMGVLLFIFSAIVVGFYANFFWKNYSAKDVIGGNPDILEYGPGKLPEIAILSDPYLLLDAREGFSKKLLYTYSVGTCKYNHYEVTDHSVEENDERRTRYYVGGIQMPWNASEGRKEIPFSNVDWLWESQWRSKDIYESYLLDEFHIVTLALNVTYSISFGFLVGLCRNGKPLLWDNDIDVQVNHGDFEKFKDLKNSGNDLVRCTDYHDEAGCGEAAFNGYIYGFKVAIDNYHTEDSLIQFFSRKGKVWGHIDVFKCDQRTTWFGHKRCQIHDHKGHRWRPGEGPLNFHTQEDYPEVTICGQRTRISKMWFDDKERFCRMWVEDVYNGKEARILAHPDLKKKVFLDPRSVQRKEWEEVQ